MLNFLFNVSWTILKASITINMFYIVVSVNVIGFFKIDITFIALMTPIKTHCYKGANAMLLADNFLRN